MRINKFLASCGLGSRRSVEEIIKNGRVKVNGKSVSDFIEIEETDKVEVDGNVVSPYALSVYLILNKPKGCVTTLKDEFNRKTVMDYIPEKYRKVVVPVGRLDYDSEGLLLLTNDGEINQKLTHPSNGVEKTYVVKIEGEIDKEQIKVLESGVLVDGKRTNPSKIADVVPEGRLTRLEITINEGRNRQVRKMFESVGENVVFLKRISIGSLKLGGMSRGECKEVTKGEFLKALTNKKEK